MTISIMNRHGKGNVKEGFYNRHPQPPYPTDCDEPPYNYPDEFLDNGTFESVLTDFIYETADEGIYDRNPYSGILGFEFTWEALTPGAILNGVCVTWMFDPDTGQWDTGGKYSSIVPTTRPTCRRMVVRRWSMGNSK